MLGFIIVLALEECPTCWAIAPAVNIRLVAIHDFVVAAVRRITKVVSRLLSFRWRELTAIA